MTSTLFSFSLRSVVIGVAASILSFSISGNAQPLSHAVPTNLPGIYAITQPPSSFDPLTASPTELQSWGYPPRPSASEGPEAMSQWTEAVSPSLKRVIPQLKKIVGVYHRPVTGLKIIAMNDKSANATSYNWSGYALTPAAGAKSFYQVEGRWIVPTVKQPRGTCSNAWDYSSQWVGIGGFSDAYLLQAGSEADVYCDAGTTGTFYVPWLEWLPNSELEIYQNAAQSIPYPFQPGDYLIVYVSATNFSGGVSTTGTLVFDDITQGWSVSLSFSAASVGGSQVTGQSAEWIVERTTVNGQLATLPDYFADPWWAAEAWDLGTANHEPGTPGTSTAYAITMLDNSKNPVSSAKLFARYALWFFPEGSAVK